MNKQKIGDIPKITPLQTSLGFPRSDPASRFFVRTYKKFIKDYKTRDGVPGVSLTKWSDVRQRVELEIMAKRFAVVDGRGQQFWPASEGSEPGDSLTWGRNGEEIVKLLAQLFFRHNQQEHQKGLSSPTKKKQAIRHERQRSQTLEQGNAGSASAPSEEMDIDPWLEDTSGDDTSLPDVGHFRLQPRGSDAQTSAAGSTSNSTPPPPGTTAATNQVNESSSSSEPVAPVAEMTGRQEYATATSTITQAVEAITERYTSSGRSCRPVQRLNFVETPTFDTEDDTQSLSPPPSRQSDPGSRLSPELGTETEPPRASPGGTPQNPRAASEPMSFDKTQLCTEDITPVLEANQATRAMPPPPLPQITRPTPEVVARRPRHSIKYSVERSPGNFRIWEHYGTFGRMPMSEFQAIHGFNDIEGVQFIVKRRGMSWDDKVPENDEVAFQDMKVRFLDLIKDDLEGIGIERDFVPYDIWIIPIRNSENDEGFYREQTIAL